MKQEKAYVSVQEAARLADVTPETIRTWVATGHLPAKRQKRVRVVYQYAILQSALKNARQVACKHCGKLFHARRPRKALFCSAKHRDRWRYEQLKKKQKAA